MRINNYARFIDDEMTAGYSHITSPIHLFLTPHSVGISNRMIFVHQKSERQVILGTESSVALFTLRTDAKDQGSVGLEVRVTVAKPTGLLGTARRIVLRIEVQHYLLTTQVREADDLASIGSGSEIGCGLASERSLFMVKIHSAEWLENTSVIAKNTETSQGFLGGRNP